MGIPKHGKNSAKAKNQEKYKSEGRYSTNKLKKAERNRKLIEKFAKRRAEKESKTEK